jgi:acetoin utilization deacetylase AcuC-like enzyme
MGEKDRNGRTTMTTALIYDDIFLEHEVPEWHSEHPDRLRAIMALLAERGLLEHPDLRRLAPRPATDDELAAVHGRDYIASVAAASAQAQPGYLTCLDPDTFIGPRSAEVARYAAGAALVGIDAVMAGTVDNAFALVRPPGHHAEANEAMGFCLFNNVAVAARYAQRAHGVGKVLIIDDDVHHGNGTQHAFYDDPTVAYCSTHQAPFYPGTGQYDEIGEGVAKFTNCNAPVPAETELEMYDAIFREVFMPFTDRFRPDLILLSAGYDTHWRDPLAQVRLDVSGQTLLTHYVNEWAKAYCGGRLVAVLEGGYDHEATANAVAASLALLLGVAESPDTIGPPPPIKYRWNSEAVVGELRRIQELIGYRRKPRPAGPAPDEGNGSLKDTLLGH